MRPNVWSLLWYLLVKNCFGVQSLALFSLEIKFFIIFNAQLLIQGLVVYHGQCILGQFWFISLFWLCSWNTGLLSPPHMSSCPWASALLTAVVFQCHLMLWFIAATLSLQCIMLCWIQGVFEFIISLKSTRQWDPKHKNDKTEVTFWWADFSLRWGSGKYLRMKREDNYSVRSKCFLRKSFSLKKDEEDWIKYFLTFRLVSVAWRSPCMSWEKGKYLYVSQIYRVGDKWYISPLRF